FGSQNNGAGGVNYVFLCPHTATPSTRIVLSDGAEAGVDLGNGSQLDGFTGQIAVVYDPPSNTQFIYTNGVLAGSGSLNGKLLSGVNDMHCWLGKSLYAGDAGLSANIDEFRIYAGAFTAAQIAADNNAGPNTVVLPGPVQGSTSPTISFSRSGSNLTLSWPASASSFTLQTSSSVGASATWTNVTNGVNQVTIPITSQTAFFRLKQ
ncbi:MAG TPA: LamG-like jellyroll fold domain-containing protein, partial [Patescibacteria group bacterium]|nr:LamG-like jellyroll fold domain-containing protein [Patescibacteria group bacterium]